MTTQFDLFERLAEGERLKRAGTEKVLKNNSEYKDRFFDCANLLLEKRGEITSEEVVEVIGMPDGSPNAIGAAMRSFAKARGLTCIEYRKSNRESRHAAVIAVWAKTDL